jgi:hypothetical protein
MHRIDRSRDGVVVLDRHDDSIQTIWIRRNDGAHLLRRDRPSMQADPLQPQTRGLPVNGPVTFSVTAGIARRTVARLRSVRPLRAPVRTALRTDSADVLARMPTLTRAPGPETRKS